MCKTKASTLATNPTPRSRLSSARTTTSSSSAATSFPTTTTTTGSGNVNNNINNKFSSSSSSTSTSTSSSGLSLASIKGSLSDQPVLYSFKEIRLATNNFLAKRFSSSSSSSSSPSWRCSLRGRDVVVFQRDFHGNDPDALGVRLSAVCRSHHTSLVRLLGASHGGGGSIFLVYEHVPGASLADCLRNPRNRDFTVLGTWTKRMQVAADVAQGLEYIHHHSSSATPIPTPSHRKPSRPIHNRIKSSSIIITEPDLRAKICHFGTAELAGEIDSDDGDADDAPRAPRRSGRRRARIEGTRGYIAPEVLGGGAPSQKADVYAFGVVLLEILTGEQPIRCWTRCEEDKKPETTLLVETARDVMGSEEGEWEEEERRRRLRRWVDRRLGDSFPVDVAEKVVRIAVECVREEARRRPDMVRVAGKLSGLLLRSREWENQVKVPTDFSVSMAPR